MEQKYFHEDNLSKLDRKKFQKVIDGKETDLYILESGSGAEVAVTNYGCTILSIMVPDKNGKFENVILGHDNIDSVINSPEPYLNTIIGRYGNRIKDGKFTLEGKEYQLEKNNGPNSLHGGPNGFHKKVWKVTDYTVDSITFDYTSIDGEEGFPGELDVTVIYRFVRENGADVLYMEYTAYTEEQATPVNITNHAFFNLSGIANPTPSIEDHLLTIFTDKYLPIDENSIPTNIASVEGTPMDFRTSTAIGARINDDSEQLKNGAGYDHCYVMRTESIVIDDDEEGFDPDEDFGETSGYQIAAMCGDKKSGRVMEVYTTEPGLQLYTGNWLNGFSGAHGATYPARSGVCFEAQKFPDTPNRPDFPTSTLEAECEYQQFTAYAFYPISDADKMEDMTAFKKDIKWREISGWYDYDENDDEEWETLEDVIAYLKGGDDDEMLSEEGKKELEKLIIKARETGERAYLLYQNPEDVIRRRDAQRAKEAAKKARSENRSK